MRRRERTCARQCADVCQPLISRKGAPALRRRRDALLHQGWGNAGWAPSSRSCFLNLARPTVSSRPRTQRRPPKSKQIRLTSTAPCLRPPTRDSRGREDARCAMIGIDEIVDRVILHAQRLLDDGAYDWPASRAALEKSWSTLRRGRWTTRTLSGCAGSSRCAMTHGKPVMAGVVIGSTHDIGARSLPGARRSALGSITVGVSPRDADPPPDTQFDYLACEMSECASDDRRRAAVQERRNHPTQTVGVSQKAVESATLKLRQGTKSLRSSPLRGGGSREAGSKPIG